MERPEGRRLSEGGEAIAAKRPEGRRRGDGSEATRGSTAERPEGRRRWDQRVGGGEGQRAEGGGGLLAEAGGRATLFHAHRTMLRCVREMKWLRVE